MDRLVNGSYWNGGTIKFENATFHGWGFESYSTDSNGEVQVSIAIVELQSGKVVSTEPDNITFIKEEKKEQPF